MTETLQGRHIVVTGGTGALGGAVVGRLLEQGAICHVPNAHAAAPQHFPFAEHVFFNGGDDALDDLAFAGMTGGE